RRVGPGDRRERRGLRAAEARVTALAIQGACSSAGKSLVTTGLARALRRRGDRALSALPWRERRGTLWEPIETSLRALLAEHELVLIEGAGSPAEINLRSTDMANMRSAKA